jgi:hypothetical protein
MSWEQFRDNLNFILTIITFILVISGITLPRLAKYIWSRRRTIWRIIYTIVTSVLTLYLFFLISFVSSKGLFNGQWALLIGVIFYWVILSWLSLLNTLGFWRAWLSRVIIIVMYSGIAAILAGFWIIRWPNSFVWPNTLLAPLILTILLLITLLIYLGYYWFTARRSR